MKKRQLSPEQQAVYDFIVLFMSDEDTQKEYARDKQYIPNRPPTYHEISLGTDIALQYIFPKVQALVAKGKLKRRSPSPDDPNEKIMSRNYELVKEGDGDER